ncbi:MAG: hypothetical protein SH859_07770 [Hyphomicrobium aestuarii]|nr:hypothetical protein [Hyphomicrobium aestuarii]
MSAQAIGAIRISSPGLRKRVRWRGAFGVLAELIANALDEKVSLVDVTFEKVRGSRYRIEVEDDSPDGFRDLSESYVMYADSYKMDNPSQRGRFNVGEKVAIVLCGPHDDVTISSTTGTVVFPKGDKEVRHLRQTREAGTRFEGYMRLNLGEYDETLAKLQTLIIPPAITVTINGTALPHRKKIASFETVLPTIAVSKHVEDEGALIKTERKTRVDVYAPLAGERAMIYEMGIPVVGPVGDLFHADVQQKVPLGIDRNSVPPKFHRCLLAAVLNVTHHRLNPDQAASISVTNALPEAAPAAVRSVMETRFGPRRFVTDFNREATGELTAEGYTAVAPGTFSAAEWQAIKTAGAIQSGSHLRPKLKTAPIPWPPDQITTAMRKFQTFAEFLCNKLLDKKIGTFDFLNNPTASTCADCEMIDAQTIALRWNVGHSSIGPNWFSDTPAADMGNLDLLIHELGHHQGDQDCTREFVNHVTKIAAKLAVLMLTTPELFAAFA